MKRIFGILLAIGMMVSFVNTNLQNDVYADISIFEETEIAPEQKIYSTATLEDDFVDNKVIVELTHEASMKFHEYGVEDFPEIECVDVQDLTQFTRPMRKASQEKIQKIENSLFALSQLSVTEKIELEEEKATLNEYNQFICIELKEKSKENVLKAISILQKRDDVLLADIDGITTLEIDEECQDNQVNDINSLSYDDWANKIIETAKAWECVTNPSTVKVAVMDTGMDGDHEDLKNVIDTSLCRDFSRGEKEIVTKPVDLTGHGTKVAGIIGAEVNNGIGINGVCKNVELVSLKVYSHTDGEHYYAAANATLLAIDFAQEQDIPVLNYSAGDTNYSVAQFERISQYDGLFVCAACNDNNNNDITPYYPSNHTLELDNVISVGASTKTDEKRTTSNYGKTSVDLFAPGENVYTTIQGNQYGPSSGTSIASPVVAGVAAIIYSQYSYLPANQVKKIILNHVDKVSAFSDKCSTGGRLNAYNALAHNSFVVLYENNPSYHRMKCSKCDFILTESHDMAISSVDSNHHQSKCRICGYANANTLADHTYKYSNITSAKHIETCTVSGRKAQVNHVYKNCKDYGNATYHQGTCLCGHYSTTVPHNWTKKTGNKLPTTSSTYSDSVNSYVWYECVDCGRISPTPPQNITSSILYVIQPNDKFLHLLSSCLN